MLSVQINVKRLHNRFFSWKVKNPLEQKGILIATDRYLEKWLPWWWTHYQRYNAFSVSLIDFGISSQMKKWCTRKMQCLQMDLPSELFELRKPLTKMRLSWFKKPFALLQTSYRKTLWIDIDCLVMGNLSEVFEYGDNPYGIAMGTDCRQYKIKKKIKAGILKAGDNNYNSGVIPFLHGSDLIEKWARSVSELEGYYLGDQDIFSKIVSDLKMDVPVLPKKFNWLVAESGINKEALILHFLEQAKFLGQKLVNDFNKSQDY